MESLKFMYNNMECDTIATYDNDKTNKQFILYTNHTYNKEKKLNIYKAMYEIKNGEVVIIPISNDEDIKIADEFYNSVITNLNAK